MSEDDNDEDEGKAFDDEVNIFKYAIETLAEAPNEVAGACLRGFNPGVLAIIANADDDVLEEAAGFFGSVDAYKALRFLASLTLTMRQAKRYEDIFEKAAE
jgi:hypothetical protein